MLRNDFLNVKNEEKTQEKDNFLENVKTMLRNDFLNDSF